MSKFKTERLKLYDIIRTPAGIMKRYCYGTDTICVTRDEDLIISFNFKHREKEVMDSIAKYLGMNFNEKITVEESPISGSNLVYYIQPLHTSEKLYIRKESQLIS